MMAQAVFIIVVVCALFAWFWSRANRIARENPLSSKEFVLRSELDFGPDVAKRLDEHRELVIDLIEKTDYLANQEATPWRSAHLATQDDYLMYIFYLRHNVWPTDTLSVETAAFGYVRPRPEILGMCKHPLFKLKQNVVNLN